MESNVFTTNVMYMVIIYQEQQMSVSHIHFLQRCNTSEKYSMYTFSVNDLIENGTKSLIFFLFESPAPHSRDHLKNKNVASGDVKLYHVERSSKLAPK